MVTSKIFKRTVQFVFIVLENLHACMKKKKMRLYVICTTCEYFVMSYKSNTRKCLQIHKINNLEPRETAIIVTLRNGTS
jgi:hypothetical protein